MERCVQQTEPGTGKDSYCRAPKTVKNSRSMSIFLHLIKVRMVIFVLFGGLAGYIYGLPSPSTLGQGPWAIFLLGLFGISSGSFILNQVQEVKRDRLMDRTRLRPLVTGQVSLRMGLILSILAMLMGLILLYIVAPISSLIGALSIALYNGPYTLYWKRRWAYGAIPGALPGAGPVLIGFSAANSNLFCRESLYMFLILFLWQMPHFWAIAIRYAKDYREGGFPVLPVAKGKDVTLMNMTIYLTAYLGIALASPLLIPLSWMWGILVVPMALKVSYEFYKYTKSTDSQWVPFFGWINGSLLLFLFVPVMNKWFLI